MEKIAVQTTGNFMLFDRLSGSEIMPGETHTVPHTTFIAERLANGDLRELSQLDHDGDGKAGGSLKGEQSTAHKGAVKRKSK